MCTPHVAILIQNECAGMTRKGALRIDEADFMTAPCKFPYDVVASIPLDFEGIACIRKGSAEQEPWL